MPCRQCLDATAPSSAKVPAAACPDECSAYRKRSRPPRRRRRLRRCGAARLQQPPAPLLRPPRSRAPPAPRGAARAHRRRRAPVSLPPPLRHASSPSLPFLPEPLRLGKCEARFGQRVTKRRRIFVEMDADAELRRRGHVLRVIVNKEGILRSNAHAAQGDAKHFRVRLCDAELGRVKDVVKLILYAEVEQFSWQSGRGVGDKPYEGLLSHGPHQCEHFVIDPHRLLIPQADQFVHVQPRPQRPQPPPGLHSPLFRRDAPGRHESDQLRPEGNLGESSPGQTELIFHPRYVARLEKANDSVQIDKQDLAHGTKAPPPSCNNVSRTETLTSPAPLPRGTAFPPPASPSRCRACQSR